MCARASALTCGRARGLQAGIALKAEQWAFSRGLARELSPFGDDGGMMMADDDDDEVPEGSLGSVGVFSEYQDGVSAAA